MRGPRRWSLGLTAALTFLFAGSAKAAPVDAELLILVDTSVAVSGQDFSDLLEGYAAAFESQSFTDALTGASGRGIAASLVFFGGPGAEQVGVPWMQLNDGVDAGVFADLIRNATRPGPNFFVSVSTGLNFATEQFGTETGFGGNGFESTTQAINMTTETFVLLGEGAASVVAARNGALASGVDVINAITVGSFNSAGAIAFYEANIVGGSANGVPGHVVNAPDYSSFPALATSSLTNQLISLVPEPGSSLLVVLSLAGLALRRRR